MTLELPFSVYCRIETAAGGVAASPRALIRATRARFRPEALTREHREARHAYLRSVLRHNQRARDLVNHFRL